MSIVAKLNRRSLPEYLFAPHTPCQKYSREYRTPKGRLKVTRGDPVQKLRQVLPVNAYPALAGFIGVESVTTRSSRISRYFTPHILAFHPCQSLQVQLLNELATGWAALTPVKSVRTEDEGIVGMLYYLLVAKKLLKPLRFLSRLHIFRGRPIGRPKRDNRLLQYGCYDFPSRVFP